MCLDGTTGGETEGLTPAIGQESILRSNATHLQIVHNNSLNATTERLREAHLYPDHQSGEVYGNPNRNSPAPVISTVCEGTEGGAT